MKRNYSFFLLTGCIFLLVSFISPAKKINIWLIGDSTMCLYETSRAPLTGWGMPFASFFDSTVDIHNLARGGRSTRTFISENRWQPVTDSLREGDYVFIQFGHNDEATGEKYKDRYTPVADYKTNLAKFISETRAKKGIPVLITPVARRNFDKAGIIKESHLEYAAAAREVALQNKVVLIDLDKKSQLLLQQFGPEHSKMLFMQLDSLQHPLYPNGLNDNTHFNEYGARRMAELVLAEIRTAIPALAERIISPQKKN